MASRRHSVTSRKAGTMSRTWPMENTGLSSFRRRSPNIKSRTSPKGTLFVVKKAGITSEVFLSLTAWPYSSLQCSQKKSDVFVRPTYPKKSIELRYRSIAFRKHLVEILCILRKYLPTNANERAGEYYLVGFSTQNGADN